MKKEKGITCKGAWDEKVEKQTIFSLFGKFAIAQDIL